MWPIEGNWTKLDESKTTSRESEDGGESTLDLCYASSEEIPELQHPCFCFCFFVVVFGHSWNHRAWKA